MNKPRSCGLEIEFTGGEDREYWKERIRRLCKEQKLDITVNFNNQHLITKEHDIHLTYDGSVTSPGIELQTRPFTFEDISFVEGLRHVLIGIRRAGGIIDLSCGLHVHIGAYDFKASNIKNLLLFFESWQLIMYALLHSSRTINHFCHHLNLKREIPNLKELSTAHDIRRHLASDRYDGLNIQPWFDYRHYEVRMCHGLLNPQRIFNWAQLQLQIAEYIKNYQGELQVVHANLSPTRTNVKQLFTILDFKKAELYFLDEYDEFHLSKKEKETTDDEVYV